MVNDFGRAGVLDVLADPTRRTMVAMLAEHPRPAGEFAERFRISRPAVSRHLRLLKSRGLVEEVRIPQDGRVRLVRLRGEPLEEMARWADRLQAFWQMQLESFKEAVDERNPGRDRPRDQASPDRTKRRGRGRR